MSAKRILRHVFIGVGVLILIPIAHLILVTHTTSWDIGKHPNKDFEDFVFAPIPPSVRDIQSEGHLGMTGDSVTISFSIASNDLQRIISESGYTEMAYRPGQLDDQLSWSGFTNPVWYTGRKHQEICADRMSSNVVFRYFSP